MKTIATAAVLMMLTATSWADEQESKQVSNATLDNEPIILSEAEMDDITAGTVAVSGGDRLFILTDNLNPVAQSPKFKAGKALKDAVN